MSAILDKLLKKQRVDWVKLGEVAEIGTGSSNRQDEDENGIYPFYVRSKNILKSNTFQFDETAIIIPGEGGIGEIFHYAQGKYALHQRAYRIHITSSKLETKYLFYVMAHSFKKYILTKSVGATATSIRKPMLEQFEIPIPPLDVQAEIVRILDAFTAVTAELTAELNMREKQYQYYRDKLLSFSSDEINWKSLGEVVKMQAGKNIKASQINPSQTDENLYPCFGGNGIRGYVNNLSHQGEHVIIGRQGALCGNVQRVKGNFYATEHAVVVTVSDSIDVDWAYHMFTFMNLNQYASKSAQPGLAVGKLEQLEIPVPSLSEQKRVAKILDKLDTITHSITEGLPYEITLRQQQYEYYREQLLDFPKN